MKKLLITAIVLGNLSGTAMAQQLPDCSDSPKVSVMAGLAYNFGSGLAQENLGFTLKALNTNEANHFVLGAGGTFYPWSDERFSMDLGAGYNFNEATALVGYDLIKKVPVASMGWVNTTDTRACFN